MIPAVVALQSRTIKDRDKAIKTLAAAAPYELSAPTGTPLYPVCICGVAYLDAHQAPSAIIEFQKILDHPGLVQNNIIDALTRLQFCPAPTP
jgi:hypothetical protein